jgi:hypothetical protein
MNKPVYRPPSVWITQILLVPFLVNFVIILPIVLLQCSSSEQTQSCSSPSRILAFLSSFLSFALVLSTFWGLQKRKRYGKWLAVNLLIGGLVVGLAKSHIFQLIYHSITQWHSLPAPPYECWKREYLFGNSSDSCGYKNYRELVWRIISDTLPSVILGFLAVRLLFGHAAKQFFHK